MNMTQKDKRDEPYENLVLHSLIAMNAKATLADLDGIFSATWVFNVKVFLKGLPM